MERGRDDGDFGSGSGGGKVVALIEKATNSTAHEVDPRLLKAIKFCIRYSDSEVRLGAQTLMELMKRNHSQVRYLTLLIIDELFMRSKLFRSQIIENLDQLLSLSVGFRTNMPLPAPPAIATLLRSKAIEFLEKWNSSFGVHYKKLRLGFDYLKHTLKFQFPNLQANAARIQRERHEREMKTKEILQNKFESLKDNFILIKDEINETIKEIKECLQIVQARDDDGVPLTILDEEDLVEFRSSHLRQIRLDSLKESEKVEETNENRVVFDALREQCKLLETKHLISVQDSISVLIRVEVTDNRIRDSMLKDFIDIRNNILAVKKKCEDAGFSITKTTRHDITEEEDIWEEDSGKTETDLAPATINQHVEDSSLPSTSESKITKPVKNKNGGQKTELSLRDKLFSEAPEMNWGSQLSNWDSTTEFRANHRGLDLESHWGRVDQDAVIPAEKIAELNLQATVYKEERSEIQPCHAPLKNGTLCQRKDLRICPFHGPIIPRDDTGNPITQETTEINNDMVPMDESTTSDSDPNHISRQIAKQALKNVRERDKQEIKRANRAKLAKVRAHNEAVLRDAALSSSSRSSVIDDQEFDRIMNTRNTKQSLSSMLRKKTTSKDRISQRLNRVKDMKLKQSAHGDDEQYRETSANQW